MDTIPVAMITAPRKANYISLTLESLFDYGFTDVTVFEEPPHFEYQHNTRVKRIYNDRKLGCTFNWLNALNVMSHQVNGPFAICEDDFIILKKIDLGIVDLLGSFGFVSPYCSKVNDHKVRNAWATPKMPTTGWCGNLFMILSVEAQKKILNNIDKFVELATFQARNPIHLDYAVGKILEEFYNCCHSPSLIFHTGEESTWAKNNSIKGRTLAARQPAV